MNLDRSTHHHHSKTIDKPGNDDSATTPPLFPNDYSRLTAEISARLVKVDNEYLDAEILRALQEALQPLGVDRGGLIKVRENSPMARVTHAWYAEGINQVSADVDLAKLFPWSFRHLVVEGQIKNIVSIDDYPADADIDRQTHLSMGIKSALDIPLFIGQRVQYLLAINAMKVGRNWPDELITYLRLLGEIFVSALQRREMEQVLRQTMERLDIAADAAGVVLWELDLESGSLWANDKAYELFGFDPGIPMSLALFLEKVHLDDHGLILEAADRARRTGSEITIEYRAPLADGRIRWMVSRGRMALVDKRSTAFRLMGVTIETTRQKLMEQQLLSQLQEIEALREQLERENTYLRNEVVIRGERRAFHNVGESMQTIMTLVRQVAPTDSTVLIQGETGTGKEVLAETIHRLSPRGKRVMVKVNCAALPAALVESELFGREKGAFTGALSRQVGRFELANGATLFLDEIAEMSIDTQAKLLRVLQEGEFERLGSPKTVKVDVRLIVATNRDLAKEVEMGRFRRDLYYRLNVFPIQLPPLRERPEDIPHLVWEFVNEFGDRMGKKIRRIASRDMELLKVYPWPGNIRELRNVIEHALIVSGGETLELKHLAADTQQAKSPVTLEEMERRHIQSVLAASGGKIKGPGGAAEQLGINPSTLYSRMRKLGIHPVHTR